jgi:hypothetical protein
MLNISPNIFIPTLTLLTCFIAFCTWILCRKCPLRTRAIGIVLVFLFGIALGFAFIFYTQTSTVEEDILPLPQDFGLV